MATERKYCPNCGTVDANMSRDYGCLFWVLQVFLVGITMGLWIFAIPFWFLCANKRFQCPSCRLEIKEKS